MRALPEIPDGWRLLEDYEIIRVGDKWFSTSITAHRLTWDYDENCENFSAGHYGKQFKWITPKEKEEEKVWLNPWD